MSCLIRSVSVGGYVILDNDGDHMPPARKAADDYRKAHNITEPIVRIDWSGVYWRKEKIAGAVR